MAKKGRMLVFVVAAIALVMMLVAGCSGSGNNTGANTDTTAKDAAKTAMVDTIQPGVLSIGSDIAFPPFENMEADKPVGFDVDLLGAIAKKLGVEAKFTNNKFDGLIPALNSKKFDAVVSAMTITADRKKEVLFSDPYIDSNQSIATKKDAGIKDIAGLKGKTVGVQTGTTGEAWSKENVKNAKEIKSYDTALDAFTALQAGQIQAVINDLPVSAYIVKDKAELQIVKEIKTDESYGVAMRKDDTKLGEAINKALKALKDDGTYDTIYNKWFGTKK
ncbi:MAG TPA: basic amino acid ABC transporter substrate-binding protein [Candidatus Aquicultor sp.]|jgi:polar amino acid transport system substrate-binding protein